MSNMKMRILVILFVILDYASSYSMVQIWSRNSGQWVFKDCSQTFVHFQSVQDVRISERFDEDCFCLFFDPNLTPDDLFEMEVVYRYLIGSSRWELFHRSPFELWRNNTDGFPQFRVVATEDPLFVVENTEGNVTYGLEERVNIQVENGEVYLLCSPTAYINPRDVISTTTTTTPQPTTFSNHSMDSAEDVIEPSRDKSSSSNNNNSNDVIIISTVAAAVVLILLIVVVALIIRKRKVVEKPSKFGLIPHIMKQRSTISQAQTLYSHNTWKGNAFAGVESVSYDNDGIHAPDNRNSVAGKTNSLTEQDIASGTSRSDSGMSRSDIGQGDGSSMKDDSSSKELVYRM